MAQSLCKIYLHIIFHTKTTSPTVETEHLERLHNYIGKLVNITGCQVLCVGGTENHVHALLMFSRTETVAHVVEASAPSGRGRVMTTFTRCDTAITQGVGASHLALGWPIDGLSGR